MELNAKNSPLDPPKRIRGSVASLGIPGNWESDNGDLQCNHSKKLNFNKFILEKLLICAK